MKIVFLASIVLLSSISFAATKDKTRKLATAKNETIPKSVSNAALHMKQDDIRTVINAVENEDGNPCMPEGTSYKVELQVKEASWNPEKMKVMYTWKTVKTVNVTKTGQVSEVCAE